MCQNNVVIVVAYEQFLLLRTKRDAVPIHLYDRIRHFMRIKKNALTNIKQHLVHSMRMVPFRLVVGGRELLISFNNSEISTQNPPFSVYALDIDHFHENAQIVAKITNVVNVIIMSYSMQSVLAIPGKKRRTNWQRMFAQNYTLLSQINLNKLKYYDSITC